MRKPMSLRLRVTLLCAALLTLCCLLLTVTNNFSAIRMADAIQAVPLLPAQRAELEDSVSLPRSGSGRLRIWRSPLRSPTAGMRRPQWPWRSIRCPSG